MIYIQSKFTREYTSSLTMKVMVSYCFIENNSILIISPPKGLFSVILSVCLLGLSLAKPTILVDPISSVVFTEATGLVLTAASGAVVTIPTGALLLGAAAKKAALLHLLVENRKKQAKKQ